MSQNGEGLITDDPTSPKSNGPTSPKSNGPTSPSAPNIDGNNAGLENIPNNLGVPGLEGHDARSTRTRNLTEKGMEYQRNLFLQRRKSHHGRLVRQLTLVAECMLSQAVEMTNQEVSNLDRIFTDVVEANLKYSELLEDEEAKKECQTYFDSVDKLVFEQKTLVCNWLRELDGSSSRSGSSRSSQRSRKSKKSSRSRNNREPKIADSVCSSASSTKSLENKAHLAGLRVEMETLEQNWETKLQEKVLSFQKAEEAIMKQQLSELKENIAITQAKQEVFDEEMPALVTPPGHSKIRSRKRSSSLEPRKKKEVELKEDDKRRAKSSERATKNKIAQKHQQQQPNTVSSDINSNIGQAVIEMLAMNSAPKIDLDIFSGSILEFEYFKSNFRELVESKVKDQRGRLARLLQYTSGDAKELIKGSVHENSETCYDHAMSLLQKEYGDDHATTCAYLQELYRWPYIQNNDVAAYKKIYRFLLKCQSFKRSGKLAELDSTDKIRTVLSKFSVSVQQLWNRHACKIRDKSQREAGFDDLVCFLDTQCKIISNPAYSHDAFNSVKLPTNMTALATQFRPKDISNPADISGKPPDPPGKPPDPPPVPPMSAGGYQCICCGNQGHLFEDCPTYLQKSLIDRRKFVFQNRMCYACLKPTSATHNAKTCVQKKTCKKCPQTHPTCLQHFSVNTISQTTKSSHLPIVPVIIHHKDNPNQSIKVYAILDDCSEGTFIKSSVLSSLLDVPVREEEISVTTVGGTEYIQCSAVDGLVVAAIPEHSEKYQSTQSTLSLPTCYTQEKLPVESENIPSPESLSAWPYLASIASSMYRQDRSVPVGLLIGNNCLKALEPHEVIPSQGDGPFALRSCLGWCVVGSLYQKSQNSIVCNATSVRVPVTDIATNKASSHHLGISNNVKECSISKQLNEMYMHDFVEAQPEKKAHSGEDLEFLRQMEEGVSKGSNGHYSLPLPFRNNNVTLPNNRAAAVKIAQGSLRKRMKNDAKFREEYTAYVKRIVDEGCAKKVPVNEVNDPNAWYIPTHPVYHPVKQKLRVVFNCAAKFQGRCLNEELLQGPDLANLSIGVLIRFRKEEVAVQADLTWMFFQVFVPEDHQKFLRFVFWPDGNPEAEMEDYQMCVHLFGAKSSTSCSIYALHRTAMDNRDKYRKDVCETILNNFYIDDLLKSYANDAEAISQILELIELCKEGGFSLTKFVSNSPAVLNAIPEERKANSSCSKKDICTDHIERALGVTWYIENDKLGFRVAMDNSTLTRRGMLSTISSTFDPFGTAGPFLIRGKRILQLANRENKSWDDPVSEDHASAWHNWKRDLIGLSSLTIERCYKPVGFGNVVHSSVHCFSDASDMGYGQVTYLRQENDAGEVAVCQVLGKARVAPSKVTTIPRLELVAATVSVKVAALVKEEIQIESLHETYYTDSEIVLGYIGNNVKRYRTFVANRRQIINTYTQYEMWRHVISAENPADLASRGISSNENDKIKLWIHGPEFLKAPRETWQQSPPTVDVEDSDPEVVNSMCAMATTVDNNNNILAHFEKRFSNWNKWIRVLVHVLRAINCFKTAGDTRIKTKSTDNLQQMIQNLGFLKMNEVDCSEKTLIKLIQQRSYPEEIKIYRNAQEKNRKKLRNRLSRLDPFLDQDGILRVGGRMKRTECFEVVKHPAILPDKAIATKRLVRYHHQKVQHSGRTTTVGEVRQSGFWVVNVNSCVRNIIYHCVPCRSFRGKLAEQKMADLPDYRTTPEGPFVLVGLDMFGPFLVKEKRSQVKRYVALYTCLSSRAVHLETTKDMSTDSFIQSLRRFMARRGAVKSIRSDNGTNFVGADNELLQGWKDMDHDKIRGFLLEKRCDWITWERNPPAASHMGGVWERQIRTIRGVLTSLLHEHSARLDDEALRTLLCEAECIVNSRPLTVENLCDADSEVLTPNHLLTMKSKLVLSPPGVFQKSDVYCRKRWKAVQYLANQFWSRWKKEFLVTLQQRNKWQCEKRNFQVGDVVLLKEENCPRNQWPMARVCKVKTDEKDGLVRAVDVFSAGSTFTRPINKLVLLVGVDEQLQE